MNKILNNQRLVNIMIPVIAALLGLLSAAIIMVITGYDPGEGFSALINGMIGTPKAVGESLRTATPLILSGISVAFAFRTGLFNIGVEGQLLVGWLASVWVGIAFNLPQPLHITVAILAAGLAGALWAFIPGLLKGRYGVNEVIVTIMMNYIALYLTGYIIREFIFAGNEKTKDINPSASLNSEWLSNISNHSRLHNGLFIAIALAVVMWFILEKTSLGFELRSVGFNRNASLYAGMNVKSNIIISMMISGLFAGVAGAMEGLGTFGHMTISTAFSGIGFDGIAVALLGGNNPFGILISAALFGGLKYAGPAMNFNAGVPSELVQIIIALIIFFVASGYIVQYALSKLKKEAK